MTPLRDDVAAGRGSIQVSMANTINMITGTALFALLPRVLTTNELGILGVVTVSYTVFQYLGQFGLNRSAASLISSSLVDGEDTAARILWGITLMSIGLSVVATIPAYLLASTLSSLTVRNASATEAFQVGAIVVLANVLSSNLEGVLEGVRDFGLLSKSRIAGQLVRIAVSLILLFYGYRVLAIIIGLFFGQYGFVTIAIQVPVLLKRFRRIMPNLTELYDILRYSLPLYGAQILLMVSSQLELIILIATGTSSQVGTYYIVLTIYQSISLMIFSPINGTVLPFMAKKLKTNGVLDRAFEKGTHYLSLTIVPSMMAFALSSPFLIRILAGTRYTAAVIPLSIVIFGLIPVAFDAMILAALQSYGKNTQVLLNYAVGIALAAIFGILAVPAFGLIGAALCRLVLSLASLTLGIFQLRRIMPVRVDMSALRRTTLASLSFVLVVVDYVVWNNTFGLGLSLIVAVALFLAFLKVLHPIDARDAQVLLESIPPGFNGLVRKLNLERLAYWLSS
jgi:O-antigen/teichoic acid export membrane protein